MDAHVKHDDPAWRIVNEIKCLDRQVRDIQSGAEAVCAISETEYFDNHKDSLKWVVRKLSNEIFDLRCEIGRLEQILSEHIPSVRDAFSLRDCE